MKRILTILGIMVCAIGFAQTFTATYDFEDVNGVTNPLTGTTDPTPPPTATGVTFGSFSAVGTPVNPNADNRFSFTDWATGATNGSNTFTGVLNTGEYYQVTITPATGYTVDLNSITFTMQRSGTGIRQYMVRSSIDGYTANLSASINPANADLSVVATNIFQVADASTSAENGSTITLGGASFTGLTSAVTFRFYALNAEAATGTFGIDNVVINGSASALVADYCIPGALGDATYRRVGKVTLTDSFTGDVFENESDIDGFTDTKPPYEDFTSLGPINLTTGSTGNTIAVKKAWRTAPDNDGTAAWIDFNGDKIFTLDERILNTQSNTNSVETATFNVPSTAVAGSLVRMRVMMRMNVNQDPPNPPNIPDPCWDFMFSQGQFEDYTVSINAPVATPKINVTASSGTATADYSTLKDAFDAINSGTHGGNIAVNVLESTTETATAVLNAGAYTSVIVKPAAGVTATISGDLADVPLVQFLGSNITIDGSNTAGGTTRDLTFNNTAVGGFFPMSQVVQFGSTSTTRTDNINLKNAEFIATDTNAYAIMFSDASSLGGDAYFKNVMMDNISVQNSYLGVYAWAATAPGVNGSLTIKNSDFTAMSSEAILALGVDGLVIDNNNIGNFVPNSEPKIGMMLGMNTINASITNNTISDISGTAEITGINVSSGHADANYTISGNTISNLEADYFSYISGIRVTGTNSNPTGDISIINNKITGINNISTSGYGAHAITLDPKNTSGTISIINNFIADVTGVGYSGGWGIFDNGYGMFLGSGSGYKIYNNTVNLATDQSSGGNMAAMNIGTGIAAGAIDLRNNIFVTTQTTGTRYAIYSASPNTAFSNIDNNDYYSAGPNLGFIGTARATLADIQTGFGGNTNSANILPVFTSGTDLHLDPATNTTLDNLGTPLADVTTDIDGETRDVATPDMGADEFGVLAAKIHVTATSGTATADYDTLKEAFDAINAGTHAGDIEVSVLESTTETATAVLNASGTGSSNYTNVVVKPAAGVTATIDGNISTAGATSMVQILGSHVTIDGSNTTGGTTRDLTFQQTITTPLCVFGINSTATSAPDDINIKNVTIVQGGGGYGIMALTDALAAGNFSNVTIDNIAVKNAGFGIFAQALPAPGVNTNFTVKNSDFSATGTDAIKVMGIYVQGVDGATIDNNTIGNFDSLNYATPNNFKRPIWIATGNLNVNITNNTISDITGSATAVSGILTNGNTTISGNTFSNLSSSVAGNNQAIFVNNTFANVSVVNNEITNIKNVSTTGWGAHGIYLAATNTTGNINVFNNFISDVTGYGYSFGFGVSDNGYGIFIASGTGYKIYNNTVSMNTNQPTNGNAAAINIASGVNTNGAVDLRNNIFSNTQTAGATRYAIYSGATAARYSNIDYNDYYSPAALGFIGGSARATLADIQTGFGGNTNSADILPVFTSATDLHLDGPTNATLDNLGTPLAEVTTDIDGDTRSTTTPDMGADEFGTPVAVSGCLSDPYGEYPHSIYTPVCNGVVGVIVPDGWAGEYSTVAVTAGTEYTFASSIATDFITISDDAGTTTLASGTGTVVWTATASANVRFYTHLDSNCTPDDQSLRARTVKCGTLTYCGPIVFDFNVEPITLVDFAGIHNETSPAINGTPDHEDFTTTVAPGNVKQGFPYQISVNGNADPIGFSYENYYVVFIDWNQNGVLNDAGEVYFGDGSLFLIDSDGVSNPPATGVITVPSGATLGNTLMRVKKVYSFGAPLVFPFTDPCEGDTYGQVEDYTITVDIPPTTAPDCTGFEITYPENQDVIAGGNVTLTWTAAANSIGYHVKVGTTFGGIEVFGGDVIGATSLTVSLDPDTIYYLSVTPYNNISDAACTEEILFQTDDSPIGCTNAPNGQWPGGTFTPACYGAPQVVAGCGYAGEYSLVAVTAGTEYIFSSSIGTDFITISDANGIVTLAAGTGPVTWTATASQVVRFYTHVDANCGAQSVCRDRMVQCGSPITFPPPPYSCYQGDGGMSGLENGYGVDPTDIFRVADDFIVPTGTLFTLKQVTINVLSAAPITNATINIHDDNGGLPGDVSDTFTMAPSSSQIFGSAFGLDAYRLTFDLVTPIDFSAGTYWLEPTISNGGGTVYWEVTTLSSTGLPVRLSNTSGVAWVPDDSGLDYNTVFYVAGDCTTLSVGEAGNTGLAYYPNPVKDVLNITSKQKVESVEIYSVAGQKVMTVSKVTDGKVNVSRLSQGVYVFRVKLENGQVETFKIVKD